MQNIKILFVLSLGVTFYQQAAHAGCGSVPAKIKNNAFQIVMDFSKSCPAAKLSSGKNIAINDYSSPGNETMYIFNQAGRCLASFPVNYGSAGQKDRSKPAKSCATNGSNATPAGIHIAGAHESGGTYGSDVSLLLAGLNGQSSAGRAILIHPTDFTLRRGSSQGCSAVSCA
jgi:hypothetical protein